MLSIGSLAWEGSLRSKQVPGEKAEASVALAFFLRRFENNYSDSKIPELSPGEDSSLTQGQIISQVVLLR